MLVDPANDGDADGITKSEQLLNAVSHQRELARALQTGVFTRGHPPHFDSTAINNNDNLLCTAASGSA
jgi:hypothetical protein